MPENGIGYFRTYASGLLAGAAIVVLGFTPVPLVDPALPTATALEYVVGLLPSLPLLLLLIWEAGGYDLPRVFAKFLSIASSILIGTGTVFISAFAGGGTSMLLLHGLAIATAVATSFLLVSTCGRRTKRFAVVAFLFPVGLGLWSLAMVPLIYVDAIGIAEGRPYCLATPRAGEDKITSLSGLRGLSFYTTQSGYKVGQSWYFHGLLLIGDAETREAFNWSPRRMEFHWLENPELFISEPNAACVPRTDFLDGARLL